MKHSPEIGIRDIVDADLAFVQATLNHEIAVSPYVYADVPVTLAERRSWLEMHRSAALPVVLAIDDRGTPLGWASLSPYRPSSGYRFTLEASVYVGSEARRRGVASRLLLAVEDAACARGTHVVVASIDAENAASIGLFERHEYAVVARMEEVGHKYGAWRTQLLLSKILEQAPR